jgi:hypothetical protein
MFDEDEEDEGRKTKLDVGGTPLVTVELVQNYYFFEKFDGNAILTDGDVLRDQNRTFFL